MRRLGPWLAPWLLLAGCGGEEQGDKVIPLDQVPPALMERARKELPGYTITAAYKKKEDGKELVELRGKDKQGRIREVELLPNGELYQVE